MRKGLLIVVVAISLFSPVRICLAGEPGTRIQLSMGMVILGGAVLFSGGSLSLKKMLKKRRERLDDAKKEKDL